jgi:hypothetical protein
VRGSTAADYIPTVEPPAIHVRRNRSSKGRISSSQAAAPNQGDLGTPLEKEKMLRAQRELLQAYFDGDLRHDSCLKGLMGIHLHDDEPDFETYELLRTKVKAHMNSNVLCK